MTKAINQKVAGVLRYFLAAGLRTKGDMRRLDAKIRAHLRKVRYQDGSASAHRLYLPRKAVGRGICRLEELYCQTALSVVCYLSEAEDEFAQLLCRDIRALETDNQGVGELQLSPKQTGCFSLWA